MFLFKKNFLQDVDINENKLFKLIKRENTFSLGVCNGCQLMIKLNIIKGNIKLIKNKSNRFESRFSTVKISESKSIFLKNMNELFLLNLNSTILIHSIEKCMLNEK